MSINDIHPQYQYFDQTVVNTLDRFFGLVEYFCAYLFNKQVV